MFMTLSQMHFDQLLDEFLNLFTTFIAWIYIRALMVQGHRKTGAYLSMHSGTGREISQRISKFQTVGIKRLEHANRSFLNRCEKLCNCNSNLFGYLPRTCDGTEIARCHQHRPVDGIKAHFQALIQFFTFKVIFGREHFYLAQKQKPENFSVSFICPAEFSRQNTLKELGPSPYNAKRRRDSQGYQKCCKAKEATLKQI